MPLAVESISRQPPNRRAVLAAAGRAGQTYDALLPKTTSSCAGRHKRTGAISFGRIEVTSGVTAMNDKPLNSADHVSELSLVTPCETKDRETMGGCEGLVHEIEL